jgi:hypothetical protein
MSNCQVLRCTSGRDHVIDVGRDEQPQVHIDAAVCDRHKVEIDAGARWLWDNQRDSGAAILMGADLPPVLRDWKAIVSHKSSLGRTAMLQLEYERADGSVDIIELEFTAEMSRSFKMLPELR